MTLRISSKLSLPIEAGLWTFGFLAIKGAGKALALDTPIVTLDGWKTMGEIKIGDDLFNEKGELCKVTYVTGIQYGRRCYKVIFDDGSFVITDAEHLWISETAGYRHARDNRLRLAKKRNFRQLLHQDRAQCAARMIAPEYVTTEQMSLTIRRWRELNHAIPCTQGLDLPEIELPLDPYVLGAWLGDGTSIRAEITTMHEEILNQISLAGYRVEMIISPGGSCGKAGLYGIDHVRGGGPNQTFQTLLRNMKLRGSKHIPDVYFRAAINQRIRLLTGLMDTDGYISGRSNSCVFYNTNKLLADGVEEIINSLGWKSRRSQFIAKIRGAPKGICYRVTFRPSSQVFTVRSKARRLNFLVSQKKRSHHRFVKAIEPVDSVPVRCIAVDSQSHLYLAGKAMIPTHNTYDACVLAEELIKSGIPIVALDSLGIWWGLRVGVDRNKGLPLVIFGGPHKDISIPSSITKGHEIVDEGRLRDLVRAMLQTRISVVLDTSQYSKSQQRRIVGVFTEELVMQNSQYGIRFVFIEEADNWVPQRSSGETAFVAGAINDLIRRGGNFNLGAALISQRAAVINKDVLTQINCLVALRILAKLDKKAVQTWVEEVAHPNDPRMAKFADSLRDLENGEAWIWHPGDPHSAKDPDIFKRVQFRKRETLHATREYFLQSKLDQANVKPLDVDEFVSKFKDKFEPKKVQQEKPLPREQTIPQSAMSLWQKGDPDLRENFIDNRRIDRVTSSKSEETKPPVLPTPKNTDEVLDLKFEPIKVHFDRAGFQVRSLSTKERTGQVAWILYHEARGQELLPWQISDIGSNYGWLISTANFKRDMKAIIEDGTITETADRRYKAPKFVVVEFEEPHPGRTEAVRQ